MNKGIILLFLLAFGIASTGQVFAQPSNANGTPHEGLKVSEQQKKQVSEKHRESVPKKKNIQCNFGQGCLIKQKILK